MFTIAFEGIDGSGKTVQVDRLRDHVAGLGSSVKTLSFPKYDGGFFGSEIGALLADKRKPNALELSPKDMSLWYALDRFEQMRGWRDWTFDYLLLNRFSLSNVAFQGSRLPDDEDADPFTEWLSELEHVILDLPIPDAYIIFDVSPLQSRKNVANKGNREYTEGADLLESNEDLQSKVRSCYRRLAEEMATISVIDCLTPEGSMRTEDSIQDEVREILRDKHLIERSE